MTVRDPYTFENHSSVPSEILRVVIGVLRSWDMPKTDYEYINMFNPDGIMDVSTSPAQGRDEMYALRAQMDDGPVVKVQHHVNSLFVLPNTLEGGKKEIIFHGYIVTYLKNDQKFSANYASWVKMSPSKDGTGELKADYWKAFIDRSAFAEAIGKMMAAYVVFRCNQLPMWYDFKYV